MFIIKVHLRSEFQLSKSRSSKCWKHGLNHGLRTPNEGINQRYLKNWVDGQTKYASAVPKKGSSVRFNYKPGYKQCDLL